MKELSKESDYIKNQLEDEQNVENILKTAYDIIKPKISYEEYKEFLINITTNYNKIEYTEENIVMYVLIIDYFMLEKQEEIFNYIIKKYIIEENKYYEKLNMYNSIDYNLTKILGTKNNISNETLKYIININNEIKELYSETVTQEILNKCKSLVKLEELNISGHNCKVNQEGIKDLKLVKKLDAHNNEKIKDVNHLSKLEKLDISGHNCGVNQEGIKDLKIVKNLNASCNEKIKDVNHLGKLEELNISRDCGVNQEGIKDLKLIKILNTYNNEKITNRNIFL